ncbi:hypothetical protein BLNAU_4207 [Blattamonas nauphoetae]|uniref:Uncharacterized protein n=1 Tax=Blattamonas nauphoetae TaxID=2049346 RepID=A0ABQ9YAQ7_9EUKA|nr:hypothetical protein BLNAU_4207 [Blattamonas nauphoetae]
MSEESFQSFTSDNAGHIEAALKVVELEGISTHFAVEPAFNEFDHKDSLLSFESFKDQPKSFLLLMKTHFTITEPVELGFLRLTSILQSSFWSSHCHTTILQGWKNRLKLRLQQLYTTQDVPDTPRFKESVSIFFKSYQQFCSVLELSEETRRYLDAKLENIKKLFSFQWDQVQRSDSPVPENHATCSAAHPCSFCHVLFVLFHQFSRKSLELFTLYLFPTIDELWLYQTVMLKDDTEKIVLDKTKTITKHGFEKEYALYLYKVHYIISCLMHRSTPTIVHGRLSKPSQFVSNPLKPISCYLESPDNPSKSLQIICPPTLSLPILMTLCNALLRRGLFQTAFSLCFLGTGLGIPVSVSEPMTFPGTDQPAIPIRNINIHLLGQILSYCLKADKLRSTPIVPSTDTRLKLGHDSFSSKAFVGTDDGKQSLHGESESDSESTYDEETGVRSVHYQRRKRLGQTRSALSNMSPASKAPDSLLVKIMSRACSAKSERFTQVLISRYEAWLLKIGELTSNQPESVKKPVAPTFLEDLTATEWDCMDDGGVQMAHTLRCVCSRWATIGSFALSQQSKRPLPLLVAAGMVLFNVALFVFTEIARPTIPHTLAMIRRCDLSLLLFKHYSGYILSNIFELLNMSSSIKAHITQIKPKLPPGFHFSGMSIFEPKLSSNIILEGGSPLGLSQSVEMDTVQLYSADGDIPDASSVGSTSESERASAETPKSSRHSSSFHIPPLALGQIPNTTLTAMSSDPDRPPPLIPISTGLTFTQAQTVNRNEDHPFSHVMSTVSLSSSAPQTSGRFSQGLSSSGVLLNHSNRAVPVSFGSAEGDTTTGRNSIDGIDPYQSSPSERPHSELRRPSIGSQHRPQSRTTRVANPFDGIGTTASSGELSVTVHSQPFCETNLTSAGSPNAEPMGTLPFTTGTIIRDSEVNPKQITDLRSQWRSGNTSTRHSSSNLASDNLSHSNSSASFMRQSSSRQSASRSSLGLSPLISERRGSNPSSLQRLYSFQIAHAGDGQSDTTTGTPRMWTERGKNTDRIRESSIRLNDGQEKEVETPANQAEASDRSKFNDRYGRIGVSERNANPVEKEEHSDDWTDEENDSSEEDEARMRGELEEDLENEDPTGQLTHRILKAPTEFTFSEQGYAIDLTGGMRDVDTASVGSIASHVGEKEWREHVFGTSTQDDLPIMAEDPVLFLKLAFPKIYENLQELITQADVVKRNLKEELETLSRTKAKKGDRGHN